MEGTVLPSGFLYKYPHQRPTWDPSKCNLSRCNSIALIMIIESGVVILNLSAFLLVTSFLFFPRCSSLWLDSCWEHSVPLSFDFSEILFDLKEKLSCAFYSLSFFWAMCVCWYTTVWTISRLLSSREREDWCFYLQILCNVLISLCNTFRI